MVMHGFAVRQRDYPQVLSELGNKDPVPYPAIGLNFLSHRMPQGLFTPFTPQEWSLPQNLVFKVPGRLHPLTAAWPSGE